MPDEVPCELVHPARLPIESLLAQCRFERLRRSGPGGQHRNKVETAVRIKHLPSGVRAEAFERRSQAANRDAAIFRLRVNLALEIRMPCNEDAPPSQLWRSRLVGPQIRVSASHQEFPALLAEALDRLDSLGYDINRVSDSLACTTSQLIKLLKKEARAFKLLCVQRERLGLKRLH